VKGEPWEWLALRVLLLRRIEIDNLAWLRAGNHIGKVGILVLGHPGRGLPFSYAFDAALLLFLLLLPAKLFSTAFFQLVASDKPMRSARASGRRYRAQIMICVR